MKVFKLLNFTIFMIIRRREDVEPGLKTYYWNLAQVMANLSTVKDGAVILEAGCGSGALTDPLVSLLTPSLFICYDLYSGVYQESLHEIQKGLNIIKGDVREMCICDEGVDAIFSNELLCELTREDVKKSVTEFYRVLKRGGVFVHGVLSPYPENRAQELVILADAYSAEPLFDKEWFSPPADELAGMLHQAGFSRICVRYCEESVRFEGEVAFEQVQSWVTKQEFFDEYGEDLRKYGLEYPMEQVISCQK